MLRAATWLALFLVAPMVATASHSGVGTNSPAFGAAGAPVFGMYPLDSSLPNVDGAGEPTIGIPWSTGSVFFQALESTYKCTFGNASSAPACTDVTPAFSVFNIDPMLHADPVTGRVYQGGLDGPCSVMGISDDDGQTWLPSRNMCTNNQLDHQTIGTGPWSASAPDSPVRELAYPRAAYYCSQGPLLSAVVVDFSGPAAACATSLDGGFTWQPFVEVGGPCGGYHGHMRVSEHDGFAVLPFAQCGDKAGYAYSANNGLTWTSGVFPDSELGASVGFDPSVGFSLASGWMYYALANDRGIHVALSKDDGTTWETLGNRTGLTPSKWLDIAPLYVEPRTGDPLRFGAFTDVMAGDDDRVAVSFLGTTDQGTMPFGCVAGSKGLVWHYYVAQSFDAGSSWAITRLSEDPVQIGGIYDGDPASGDGSCRNLLDFNDMDIDGNGRIHIGFADGCRNECAAKYFRYVAGGGQKPEPTASRDRYATIFRQEAGRGLFAKDDNNLTAQSSAPALGTSTSAEQATPAAGLGVALVAVALALAFSRRRGA